MFKLNLARVGMDVLRFPRHSHTLPLPSIRTVPLYQYMAGSFLGLSAQMQQIADTQRRQCQDRDQQDNLGRCMAG